MMPASRMASLMSVTLLRPARASTLCALRLLASRWRRFADFRRTSTIAKPLDRLQITSVSYTYE